MALKNKTSWGIIPIESGKIKEINIADLDIFVHLLKHEIKIAYVYSDGKSINRLKNHLNDNLEWKRWPINKGLSALRFDPVPPDRPILVKPESTLNLTESSESRIFCRIPLSIKISTSAANKTFELFQIPSVKLSNTWFGTFREGEICYSISSGIRTEIEPDDKRPYLAICPIKLKNMTKEHFLVEKMCLRSDFMTLFLHKNQIWTDEIMLTYEGKNEISQISFSGKPAGQLSGTTLIAKPRQMIKKSIYVRSFSTIKDLYESGLFASK